MTVLVLRLAGPLQSWGISSKFNTRDSGTEPSKSGVIGMLAAALGRRRDEPVDDIASLRFGVRLDQPGTVVRDFHTAHIPPGAHNKVDSYVTNRYYIEDAVFLGAFEGERGFLEELDAAVRSPAFPLFLGRRSCPPAGQVSLGVHEGTLEEILRGFEWQASEWYRKQNKDNPFLEIVMDSADGNMEVNDQPLSFSPSRRSFRRRRACRTMYEPEFLGDEVPDAATEHDALGALRGD